MTAKLALEIPGSVGRIQGNPAKNFLPAGFQLADAINAFAEVAIFVGGFLMFFWMAWGVFDYIRAEGNKEALAKARKRIQWAIVGFIILLIAFYISDYLMPLLPLSSINTRQVKPLTF